MRLEPTGHPRVEAFLATHEDLVTLAEARWMRALVFRHERSEASVRDLSFGSTFSSSSTSRTRRGARCAHPRGHPDLIGDLAPCDNTHHEAAFRDEDDELEVGELEGDW